MNLFDCETIHINKIYSVEKYSGCAKPLSIKEYGTFFNTYEIVFYLSGETVTIVDGVEIHDCAGSIRYMPKGQSRGRYTVQHLSEYSSCIDVYFDADSPMPEHATGLLNNENLKDKFMKLFDTWQKKSIGYYASSMMIFYDIISSIQRQQHFYLSGIQKEHIQKAYEYIVANYRKPDFNYKELCHTTGLEYAYFSELFKKTFKLSPVRFVTKMRIDYAKELLVTNRWSVSEIAEMCGFSNTYYFSNVFKKQTGFSPSLYPIDDI